MIHTVMLAAAFVLHSGDRVVFYGDSITEQRMYTTYVEAFITTRYPWLDIEFFNRGWSGDSSWGGGGGTPQDRAKLDVASLKPTMITVMLGMNDGGYVPVEAGIQKAIDEWYPKVLDALTGVAPKAQLTLIRTSPWDDYAHSYRSEGKPPQPWGPWKGYNSVLRHYGQIAQREANKRNALFADFNEPLSNVLIDSQKDNPDLAKQIIPDSIHPGPAGHLIMAAELLKAWKADPTVSDVEIDGRANRVISESGAKVSNLKDLEWAQLDRSIPFVLDPNDPAIQLAAKLGNFDESLNRQILKVTGLEPGSYIFTIDSAKIAKLSAEQLAQGVNLAKFDTPMRKQSTEVLNLIKRKTEIEFFAWRRVQREGDGGATSKSAYDSLEKLSKSVSSTARETATPKLHQYLISKM